MAYPGTGPRTRSPATRRLTFAEDVKLPGQGGRNTAYGRSTIKVMKDCARNGLQGYDPNSVAEITVTKAH